MGYRLIPVCGLGCGVLMRSFSRNFRAWSLNYWKMLTPSLFKVKRCFSFGSRSNYVCSPDVTGKHLSTELIANHLYAPSYISMSSALRYYGLIPENVYVIQSMTLKHSRDFNTTLGRFEYTHISQKAFSIGVTSIIKDNYAFVMATPEKALCDLIANSPSVNLRYLKDAEIYLEEDIRMDLDNFRQMDIAIFEEYANVGKKAESIKTLLKLLRK